MLLKYFINFIVLTVFLLPIIIWYRQTGDLLIYLSSDTPDGQFLYVLSKLIGMYALLCIILQLIVSLLEKSNMSQFYLPTLPHRTLGIIVVVLAVVHLLLFFFAVSLRQGFFAWNLFLPDFHDYYHIYLSLGLIGLWVLLAVLFSGLLRAIFSKSNFCFLHNTYWIAIALICIHSFSIGTEVQSKSGVIFFGTLGVVAFALLMNLLVIQKKLKLVILE